MEQPTSMNWDEYFSFMALAASSRSKDATKVGAVLVGEDNEILLTGYNGPPMGVNDTEERRTLRPLKYFFVAHAEQNLVAFAARNGIKTKGLSVYVTHKCCSDCCKILIQAGIKKIVYGPGKTSMPEEHFIYGQMMCEEAGVQLGTIHENHQQNEDITHQP